MVEIVNVGGTELENKYFFIFFYIKIYMYVWYMNKEVKRYSFPLKLNKALEEPIRKIAQINRRKINEELNIAVENHINQNKKLLK